MGVLVVNKKLNMSQHCAAAAMKANWILGCTHRGIASRDRDVIIPLSACQAWSTVFLSPQFKKDMDRLQRVQRQAVKMTKGLENLPYEERLKELGLFTLEKRWLSDDLITVFQYLKGQLQRGWRLCPYAKIPVFTIKKNTLLM